MIIWLVCVNHFCHLIDVTSVQKMSSTMTGFPTWVSMSFYSSNGGHGSRLVVTEVQSHTQVRPLLFSFPHTSMELNPLPRSPHLAWFVGCSWKTFHCSSKHVCSTVILAAKVNTPQYNSSDHDGDRQQNWVLRQYFWHHLTPVLQPVNPGIHALCTQGSR